MVAVSDIAQHTYLTNVMTGLRQDLDTLEAQSSSGKLAQTFSGLGGTGADISIAFRAQESRLDSYTSAISTVSVRTDLMDKALTQVNTYATDFVKDLLTPIQGGDPGIANFNANAHATLTSVISQVNTFVDGRYVFNGDQGATPPVANQSTLESTVNGIVSGYNSGNVSTVLANIDALVSSSTPATNASLGLDPTVNTAGGVTVRVDDQVSLDYTVKADNKGYKGVMVGLAVISQLQYSQANEGAFYQIYNKAIALLKQGGVDVTSVQSTLGVTRQQLDSYTTQHTQTKAAADKIVGSVEDADMGTVASKLQQYQTQLQIVYNVIAGLKDMTLAKYL